MSNSMPPNSHDDEQWLDALRGSPQETADPKIKREAAALRKALAARRDTLDASVPFSDESLYTRIRERFSWEDKNRKESFFHRWRGALAFAIASFVLGMAVARVVFVPSMQGVRSATPPERVLSNKPAQYPQPSQVLALRVPDPQATVESASREAIRLGLTVLVEANPKGFYLYIDGFVPDSARQLRLRQVLGLGDSAAGKLGFLVTTKND